MSYEPNDFEDFHHGEGPHDWVDDDEPLEERREIVGQRDLFGGEVAA